MYKIGQFSRLTGISIPTLRAWDKKGILKQSSKHHMEKEDTVMLNCRAYFRRNQIHHVLI
jgi:predicted site-specific integrase-resolvase